MCNNFSTYMPVVKYPYSNIDKPIYSYERVVGDFFSSMYEGISFRIRSFTQSINIQIFDVNPHKVYNPSSFEPSYRVNRVNNDKGFITQYEFFETFYAFIPDVVPYLNFQLFVPNEFYGYDPHSFASLNIGTDGFFEEFNLREFYYRSESRKEYDNNLRITDRTQLRYDEFYG